MKQIEIFEKFSYNFRKKENYLTIREADMTQIIFGERLERAVNYYSFLKLIWREFPRGSRAEVKFQILYLYT